MNKSVKTVLRKSQSLRGLRQDMIRVRDQYLRGRTSAIRRYLAGTKVPALHLGASHHDFPGWLNTDVEPATRSTVYLDATAAFPLPDDSFQYIYAEHMIEHISRADGLGMLRECRRVLKPGGVLRLTTPDLSFLMTLYDEPANDGRAYIQWIGERYLPRDEKPTAALVINNAFRAWGHQFLYNAETLTADLRKSGFAEVKQVAYNASDHDMLRGIERHGVNVGNEDMVKLETMIFEAC